MIGSKFVKVLILGISITVLSSGVAFANTGSGQSAVVEGQQSVLMTTTTSSPDTAIASPEQENSSKNEAVLKKQKEIDMYVFEEHANEIAEKGFMVTHTAPIDNHVEIGITPYNEANVDYLYEIFGKEQVKVVEGQQPVTMEFATGDDPAELAAASGPADLAATSSPADLAATSNPAELAATSSPADPETASNTGSIILAGVAGAAVLGGTFIVASRRRAARR